MRKEAEAVLKEKKWILPVILTSIICFLIGAAIAYYVIVPAMLSRFKSFIPDDMEYIITIGTITRMLLTFSIMFGLFFQLPLLSYILVKMGIIKHTLMSHYRRHAIVVIFAISAVLTPPDPITMIMMAIPFIVLYELSIQIARFTGKNIPITSLC